MCCRPRSSGVSPGSSHPALPAEIPAPHWLARPSAAAACGPWPRRVSPSTAGALRPAGRGLRYSTRSRTCGRHQSLAAGPVIVVASGSLGEHDAGDRTAHPTVQALRADRAGRFTWSVETEAVCRPLLSCFGAERLFRSNWPVLNLTEPTGAGGNGLQAGWRASASPTRPTGDLPRDRDGGSTASPHCSR